MKKILFICALAFMANMATAQTKACCKGKKACTKTAAAQAEQEKADLMTADGTIVASAISEAELLAAKSPNIEKKVCSKSGKVSFLQKNVCSKSGSVSYEDVQYDAKSQSFVGSAMVEMIEGDATIQSLEGAATDAKPACTKGAKACCKKGEKNPASCCKGDKSKKCSKSATTTNL